MASSSPPGGATAAALPWDVLRAEVTDCTRCRLHVGRTHVVFGEGDPSARLVFVGDAPGRHEDLQGRPFVGAVGNLLDNLLMEVGLTRGDVYLTTVVKCHAPATPRPPAPAVDACRPYLHRQLAHMDPSVIVALGELATNILIGRPLPLAKVAGYRLPLPPQATAAGSGPVDATLIPTYHPTVALRGNPAALAALRRDVRVAKGVLDGRIASASGALAELRAQQAAQNGAGEGALADQRGATAR
ncbi:MAG TPA: uracil-DNA glycosylase [Nitriliruptorales bacterium]|nr:uracil-DNA glycosylase [Nitriliruptorales bacterium]